MGSISKINHMLSHKSTLTETKELRYSLLSPCLHILNRSKWTKGLKIRNFETTIGKQIKILQGAGTGEDFLKRDSTSAGNGIILKLKSSVQQTNSPEHEETASE